MVHWVLEKVLSTLDEDTLKRCCGTVAGLVLDRRLLAVPCAVTAFFMLNLASVVALNEGVSAARSSGIERMS